MARANAVALLLPPSEGKAAGGDGPPWSPDAGRFGVELGPARETIAAALRAAGGGTQRLLGVGGQRLERAQLANASLIGAPTMPAGRRYTGVVWDHLDLASLPVTARRRAERSIVVLSGLLGAVAVGDPIPDYRLKMGASLPGLGVLARWWRPTLGLALQEWVAGRTVVDLLPKEHRAAWPGSVGGGARLLRVSFVERTGKVAGHDAKAAKGLLARHVLLEGGDPRAALVSFHHDRFDLHIE